MGKTQRADSFWNLEQQSQDLGKDKLKTEEDRTYLERMNTKPYICCRLFLGCLTSILL